MGIGRRRRALTATALSGLSGTTLSLLFGTPVPAVDVLDNAEEHGRERCLDDEQPEYYFDSNFLTTSRPILPEHEEHFRAGFELWNAARDIDGRRLVDVAEWIPPEPGSGDDSTWNVHVSFQGIQDDSTLARAFCRSGRIEFSDLYWNEFVDDTDLAIWVAAHEMGHVLSMNHSGIEDSPDGLPPLMATCPPRR